jgi:predicted secreted protein
MMVDDDEDEEMQAAVSKPPLLKIGKAPRVTKSNSKQSLTDETEPVVAAKASTSANAKSSAPAESVLTRKTSKSRLVKLKKDTEVNSQKNQVLKKDLKDKLTLL